MSKKGTNQVAIIAAMLSLAHANAIERAFTPNGNTYPINNRKGFAARDKRKSKK